MERERLTIVPSVEPLALNVETALTCGQIVQELLSNCCKHAFPGRRRGTISLGLHRAPEGRVVLTVSDGRVGLPGGVDVRELDSLGWSLVRFLTDKLGGTILLERGPGTTVRLTFRPA
jgi:two-component sensor histidine kinase